MIIQCKSCEKKFVVPDSAISKKGRLVQCSSCGNKWTQYPINQKTISTPIEEKEYSPPVPKAEKKITKKKQSKKRKKSNVNQYTEEYLKKKHGIKIIDPSSLNVQNEKKLKKKSKKHGFGFYNYLIVIIVLVTTFIGVINISRDLIIINFPHFEPYIDYLFETINNIKLIFTDIISNY
jgi:predicted Zn finger-like uncharacterized protein